MTGHARLAFAAIVFLLCSTGAFAATLTWTGAAGGGNNTWSTASNWSPGAIPATGDDLVLNGGAQTTSNNTISGVPAFNTISVTNHVIIASAPIALNAGLTAEAAQISLGSIKLNNAQTFTAPTSGAGALITSPIDNNGKLLSVDGPGNFVLTGAISGAGGLTKIGSGTLQLLGPNSYTGDTRVDQGTLLVFGSQPASEVHISNLTPPGGNGTLGGSGTVGPVSFTFGGTITPGALNTGTGILSINGDLFYPFTAISSLVVDIKGSDPGSGYDQVKTTGDVFLGTSTSLTVVLDPAFTPARGATFTIIKNDGPNPINGTFGTRVEGAVVIAGGTTFVLSYRGGDGNDVVLRVPAIWDGGGTDNNWSTAANWVGDVVPVAGDLLLFPNGAPRTFNNNDFPAGTAFAGLIFTGQFAVTGNRIALGAIGLVAQPSAAISAPITLAGPSFFQVNAGTLTAGDVDIGPHTLTVNALANSGIALRGAVAGTGEIHKFGGDAGRIVFHSDATTLAGAIRIFSGDMLVVDSQITAPVFLQSSSTANPTLMELTGTGSIGPLTVGGAQVSAGVFDGAGVLTVKGDATFAGNINFPATLVVTLAGATLNNQDKLKVDGAVKLQKAALSVVFENGFAPAPGSVFVIIANDGVDPVQGIFGTQLEGSTFVVGGTTFRISYQGGDGNDVALTVAAAAPVPAPSPSLANISTRLRVLAGDDVLIGGMIATGSVQKKVIIRAIGPTLTDLGLAGALPDPTLELFQGNVLIGSNDDWRNSVQQADIENSGFAPGKDAESAIIVSLNVNQNYTAIVRGKNGQTGIGLVEAFDLDELVAAKLANISTRGFVDVDDNVMIAGLIVTPSGAANIKVLARALGPTLGDFGVPGSLADPTLDLVGSNGTVIRSSNNWKNDGQRTEIEAAGLAPTHDEEAALVETLAPGAYTAIVRGNGRTTGVGLVEVYNIP